MKLLRHPVASFVIFAVLVGSFITIYEGIEFAYGIDKGDVRTVENLTTGNIMDQFKEMNLIEGVAGIDAGISKLSPGAGERADILGGLAAVGLGALKTVIGLITAPYSMASIILGYYAGEIPGILGGLVTMVSVYVVFLLLSAYLRSDV